VPTLTFAVIVAGLMSLLPRATLAVSVGPVADLFNVYAIGDIGTAAVPYQQSEFQGITGAGGSAYFDNFSINSSNVFGPFGLLTGQGLTFTSGTINGGLSSGGPVSITNVQINGNANTGSTFNAVTSTIDGNLTTTGAVTGSGLTVTGSKSTAPYTPPIDIAALNNSLINASNSFAALTQTGSFVQTCGGGGARPCTLTFDGASGQNVFDVDASLINQTGSVNFTGAPDATFIIDILGTNIALAAMGFNLAAGIGLSDILWNVTQVTSVILTQIQLPGTLLAPNALVNFTNASIDGSLYANDLIGNGESHVVPETGTWAMLLTGLVALFFAQRRGLLSRVG
jgi:choice-of-anchor A domain-containing protein